MSEPARPLPENPEEWDAYVRERVTADTPWRGILQAKRLLALARSRADLMDARDLNMLAVGYATVARLQHEMETTSA